MTPSTDPSHKEISSFSQTEKYLCFLTGVVWTFFQGWEGLNWRAALLERLLYTETPCCAKVPFVNQGRPLMKFARTRVIKESLPPNYITTRHVFYAPESQGTSRDDTYRCISS
jgi:hypothetical protein